MKLYFMPDPDYFHWLYFDRPGNEPARQKKSDATSLAGFQLTKTKPLLKLYECLITINTKLWFLHTLIGLHGQFLLRRSSIWQNFFKAKHEKMHLSKWYQNAVYYCPTTKNKHENAGITFRYRKLATQQLN